MKRANMLSNSRQHSFLACRTVLVACRHPAFFTPETSPDYHGSGPRRNRSRERRKGKLTLVELGKDQIHDMGGAFWSYSAENYLIILCESEIEGAPPYRGNIPKAVVRHAQGVRSVRLN